ncbi:hypothetical protein ACQR0V_12205 [Bradyrhizobium sp. HKCCYLS2058]|uniref:hypothetical protein n=1 Tax=unclassified Bradyrhizobium TaxID=2631580 RepID=UPI003EB99ADD
MKTIAQIYAESMKSLPVEKDGRPNAEESLRIRWEAHGRFWMPIRAVLDPRDEHLRHGGPAEQFFHARYRTSPGDRSEGVKLLKQLLRVERLTFSTFFKVNLILREAIELSLVHHDVDVALSAVLVFLQLELGARPDPEYGNFCRTKTKWNELRDENLSDDPAEAEVQLNASQFEGIGRSEMRSLHIFGKWRDVINSAEYFEKEYPGMENRRPHLLQAIDPVLEFLDPFYDGHTLDMCMAWMGGLLRRPLEEHRMTESAARNAPAGGPPAEQAA